MRFLLHGQLAPAVADALVRHGHKPASVAEAEMPADAEPLELLRLAHQKQLDVLTTSAEVAEALFKSRQRFDRAIVYLQLAGGEVEQDDAIDRLFKRYKSPAPGRLYTVTGSRVKVRQLPHKP